MVAEQITLLLEHFPVAAIKTGLLYSGEIVSRVAATLRDRKTRDGSRIPLVIDPVMVATSGDLLLQKEAIQVYENELFPLAAVVTPNLDEAAALLGEPIADLAALRTAGERLATRYGVPMLLKGGHLAGDTAVDLLLHERRHRGIFCAVRARRANTRNRMHLLGGDRSGPRLGFGAGGIDPSRQAVRDRGDRTTFPLGARRQR